MCLDAGDYDKDQGKALMIWECNGQPQQTWDYDATAQRIYLPNSLTDASLCLDAAGQSSKPGTAVDVWKCNDLWNQKFWVPPGYAPITTWKDNTMCLDLPGGKAFNGAKLQLWPCNNLVSQMWWFGVDDWKVRYSYDTNYCIDAGGMGQGSGLFLWECNGLRQQSWGYDANMTSIYLANTTSGSRICMDALGGDSKVAAGMEVGIWECNELDNQKWLVQWYGDGFRGATETQRTLAKALSPPTADSIIV